MAKPAQWQQVDVTLHSEQDGGVMLVSGTLPESAKLPAEAELSVPAGSSLQWVGQILGGSPSADPELTYTKSTVDGSDVYRFTLTKSRIAQIEIVTKDGVAFDGTDYEPTLKWTATQAVPVLRLSVRIPQTAQIVQEAPEAALQPGSAGYSFYTKTIKKVKPGDQAALAFSYKTAGAAPTSGGGSAASSGSTAQVLVILVAVVAGVIAILAIRSRMPAASAEDVEPAEPPVKSASRKQELKTGKGTGGDSHASAAETAAVEDASGPRRSAVAKRNLVTASIVGGIVVVALIVGIQTTKPQIEGDSISQTFSQGQPCSSATIALAVPADADPLKTAETLFTALRSAAGMNTAKYNFKTSTLEAGFCESKATEESVRAALAPTGMVAESAPAAE